MANNQVGSRLIYENAKSFLQSQGYSTDKAVMTQSYVRSEVALSASTANYHIPLLVNDTINGTASGFPTERRIQLQDIHVAAELFIGIAKPSSSTATNFQLYTYPSPSVFTTSYTYLPSLYNGYFNLQVNNQNVVPAIDVYRNYWVGQTQANTNFNAATATSPAQYTNDQNDGTVSGWTAIEPNILLNGAANLNASVILPSAITTVDTNSRLVVIFRTILCQNVTSVR
jgi:hypothetical protein